MYTRRGAFYDTPFWRSQRKKILERDEYKCVVCGSHATVVDHIKARPKHERKIVWEFDNPKNLRSLCKEHDNIIKELPNGERRNKGVLFSTQVDAMGYPIDKAHPANKARGF